MKIRRVCEGDAGALAHILVSANEKTFRGVVPDKCLEFTVEQSAENWARTLSNKLDGDDLFFVAERDGGLAGYVWAQAIRENHAGEIKQIMVDPEYQRQGVGRFMLKHVAGELSDRGVSAVRVEVLRCNPNRAFYEHAGAEYVSERPFDWDGVELPMCLYRWRDLEVFKAH